VCELTVFCVFILVIIYIINKHGTEVPDTGALITAVAPLSFPTQLSLLLSLALPLALFNERCVCDKSFQFQPMCQILSLTPVLECVHYQLK